MKRVLSLGVGVQSSTLLLMSHVGFLPRLDAAVFADPGWESKGTYAYLEYLQVTVSIPIHVVSIGSRIRDDILNHQVKGRVEGEHWASMPMFTLPAGAPITERGMIRRQCTRDYKLNPLRKQIRSLCSGRPDRGEIEQWIGISQDEAQRRGRSDVKYIQHRYPLLDDLDSPIHQGLFKAGYSRWDCVNWLKASGFRVPPKSSCLGCPFHSDVEWVEIKAEPEQWADVCEFDDAIRNCGGMRGQCFLHSSCKPLRDVELKPKLSNGMGMVNECMGMCGN